jgi:glycosyltransferase involved in cell wall biosynthesis
LNTGYLGAMLPKHLARLGADVHLLAGNLPPYWHTPAVSKHYVDIVGQNRFRPGHVERHDGYLVHVLPVRHYFRLPRLAGLRFKLLQLTPDVVYSLTAIGWIPLELAALSRVLGFKLFTGSHTTASTFPLYHEQRPWYAGKRLRVFFTRAVPGRLISLASERCHGPTVDSAEIAWRYFGVQRSKVEVLHLGVDTDIYYPVRDQASAMGRTALRTQLGFHEDDIVVVYTGKLTEEKHVPLLVRAVARVRDRGLPLRCLVIGDGPQRDSVVRAGPVVLLPFQPYHRLGDYYRASDIAAWPTNESTSMLDAAACGLPIIISDGVVYRDHVEGNGVVYRMHDINDLVRALTLLTEPELRARLGRAGSDKMAARFSWLEHARRRLRDYEDAVPNRRQSRTSTPDLPKHP